MDKDVDFKIGFKESSTMTTLFDSGILENLQSKTKSKSKDPISLMEIDEPPVIDLDDVEDSPPVYSLIDEEEEDNGKGKQCFSSHKIPLFTLPTSFFDIDSNIELLKKCRPISIKVVDCDIYPWYYKEIKNFINNHVITNSIKDSNQEIFHDSADVIDLTNTCDEDKLCSFSKSNHSKINLSPEQTSVVMQLKEKVQACVAKENKNVLTIVDEEINALFNCEDNKIQTIKTRIGELSDINKSVSEEFSKDVNINNLLTCKTIAQTIVHAVDELYKKNKTNYDNIGDPKPHSKENSVDLCKEYVNNIMLVTRAEQETENNIKSRNEKKAKRTPKAVKSPILPYKTRPQKTKALKQKPPKRTIKLNEVFEQCDNFYGHCDKLLTSSNRLIPHYHRRVPVSTVNSHNYPLFSATSSEMNSPEFISRDSRMRWVQPIITSTNSYSKTDTITAYDCLNIPDAYRSSFNERSYPAYYNESIRTNHQIENANIQPFLIDHQYCIPSYVSDNNYSFPRTTNFPSKVRANNVNNMGLSRRAEVVNIRKGNCYDLSQYNTQNTHVHNYNKNNSMSIPNRYGHYNATQMPPRALSNMGNETNPVLTHILSCNNIGCYHHELEQGGICGSASITGGNGQSTLLHNYGTAQRPYLPSYEEHVSSISPVHNNNFQYPVTQSYSNNVSNTEGSNIYKATPDKQVLRSTDNKSGCNNFPTILIDATKDTNIMAFETNSLIDLASARQTTRQSVNHIPSARFEANGRKAFKQMNRELNTQNNTIQLPKFEDIKKPKHYY